MERSGWHAEYRGTPPRHVTQENRQGTPNAQPGKEGRAGGTGPAVKEARELPAQCQHIHSHTNRPPDSLNNVDRPRHVIPHRAGIVAFPDQEKSGKIRKPKNGPIPEKSGKVRKNPETDERKNWANSGKVRKNPGKSG